MHLREFGSFRIDLQKKVLWHKNAPVHLPAKAVELLCVLVEYEGDIVTKNELLDTVWKDSFVEEGVLAQNIHRLRKTFRDLQLKADLIQTIPRRGYRFTGPLRPVPKDPDPVHGVKEYRAGRKHLTPRNKPSRKTELRHAVFSQKYSVPLFLFAVVCAGVALWLIYRSVK